MTFWLTEGLINCQNKIKKINTISCLRKAHQGNHYANTRNVAICQNLLWLIKNDQLWTRLSFDRLRWANNFWHSLAVSIHHLKEHSQIKLSLICEMTMEAALMARVPYRIIQYIKTWNLKSELLMWDTNGTTEVGTEAAKPFIVIWSGGCKVLPWVLLFPGVMNITHHQLKAQNEGPHWSKEKSIIMEPLCHVLTEEALQTGWWSWFSIFMEPWF